MSVLEHLGVGSTPQQWGEVPSSSDCGLLAQAERDWDRWATDFPELVGPSGVTGLRGWLGEHPERREGLLRRLLQIGSPEGEDELAAAAVVVWILTPPACGIARRLRWVSPQIDELVAGQLWVEVRAARWQTWRAVTTAILARTAHGITSQVSYQQYEIAADFAAPGEAATVATTANGWLSSREASTVGHEDDVDELRSVLDAAEQLGVITSAGRTLLDKVVRAAASVDLCRTGGRQGLTASRLARLVASQAGVSEVSVRRHLAQLLDALHDAAPQLHEAAA